MTIETNGFYLGDCLELMKEIPDGSIDSIIADLPYQTLNKRNAFAKWDTQLPFKEMWEQFLRVTKRDAAIVLFAQGMFTAQLMMSKPSIWRYNLVWKKGERASGFLNAKKMPLRNHEDICVFYRKQPVYHPQMMYTGKPNHARGKSLKVVNRCYGRYGRAEDVFSNEKYPMSIINFDRPHPPIHPTEKSVDLIRWLVRTYTNQGDVILDPTAGSGTTCIACIKEQRRWIGIERDEKFHELAKRRISEVIQRPDQMEFDFRRKD